MSVLERDQESKNGKKKKNREDMKIRVTRIKGTWTHWV